MVLVLVFSSYKFGDRKGFEVVGVGLAEEKFVFGVSS
jgi:hypothetical protein